MQEVFDQSVVAEPSAAAATAATAATVATAAQPAATANAPWLTASAAAAALLAACGGGGGGASDAPAVAGTTPPGVAPAPSPTPSPSPSPSPSPPPAPTPVPVVSAFAYTSPSTDEEAARFLTQAQFHASDSAISEVRRLGYAPYLAAQIAAPAGQSAFDWMASRGYSSLEPTTGYYDQEYPGDYMIWNQLMASPAGVRKRVALALSEFFVVSLAGMDINWRSQAIAAWWDMLSANAFGNYRTLLEGVTLSPAMGYFLNTRGNLKEDVARARLPDENYGREVMQLFTIGLSQLNLDGTAKVDATGAKIDTYTSADVTNLARVFTGWNFDLTKGASTVVAGNRTIVNIEYVRTPMTLTAANHTTLASTFLGTTIAANTDGATALKTALDTLFNHPNVGPFFGKQMIQRLVTSNPSPVYVERVARAFNNNGAGVRGDLSAVFAAVLLDDEARGPAGLSQSGFGKLREPMVRFVQWARTFGATSLQGSWKIGNLGNPGTQLGQSPLRPPSVFNFFRPGYVPPSSALSASQTPAPEFQLVNESSVGGYLNFMQSQVRDGMRIYAADQPNNPSGAATTTDIAVAYTAELALVLDASALVRRLNLLLCAGQLSAANQSLIVSALNATPLTATSTDSAKRDRVASTVLLVMASSDYLIQK